MRRVLAIPLLMAGALSAMNAGAQGNDKPLPWALRQQPGVVTLVNLHPDPARKKLSSVNYQQQGFLPLCTKVEVVAVNGWRMKFRVLETGDVYEYKFHSSLQAPKIAHLDTVFGTSCPLARVEAMSPEDQAGIRAGTVNPGMSKDGVVLAIGYPPDHQTPSLDSDEWRYWRSRMRTMLVVFEDGKVAAIRK